MNDTTTQTAVIGVEEEPRIQFTVEHQGEHPPRVLELGDKTLLIRSGAYLSKGAKYRYFRATVERAVIVGKGIRPWKQYTKLEG